MKKECEFYVKEEPFEEQIYIRENVGIVPPVSVVSPRSIESVEAENINLKMKLKSIKEVHRREISEYMPKLRIFSRENKSMAARINQLMRCKGEQIIEKEIDRNRDAATDTDDDVYEVEKIVSHKIRYGKEMFLVRWKGFESKHDTWERKDNLNCPQLLKKYYSENEINTP